MFVSFYLWHLFKGISREHYLKLRSIAITKFLKLILATRYIMTFYKFFFNCIFLLFLFGCITEYVMNAEVAFPFLVRDS